MAGIFISYRRQDSEGSAGRLLATLRAHFGVDRVFIDVTGIEPGLDFRTEIENEIQRSDVLIAVIGKHWLAIQKERQDDPRDYVRIETASALRRRIPVIPVTVEGARLPVAEELPEDIRELAFRNGKDLRHTSWDDDCAALIRILDKHVPLPAVEVAPAASQATSPPSGALSRLWRWRRGGVWLVALLVAGVSYFAYRQMTVLVPRLDDHERVEAATERFRAAGLEVAVSSTHSLEAPPGEVLSHAPPALTRVWRGSLVELTVATMPPVVVPELLGTALDEAVKRTQMAGLTLSVRLREGAIEDVGKVVEQKPKPGIPAERGDEVQLVVGTPRLNK